MATLYKCPNLGNCEKADRSETIAIPTGAPAKCPECEANLILAKSAGGGDGASGKGLAFAALGGLLLLLSVGFVGWWFWGGGDDTVASAPADAPTSPSATPAQQVVPEATPTPAPGAPAASPAVPAAPPPAAPAEPVKPSYPGTLESELESQFKSKSPLGTALESALKPKPPGKAGAEGIGMVTGSTTGTYYRFGNDIAAIAQDAGLTIAVKASSGSIDNIERLASVENAALGIVQSDVLGYLSRSDNPDMRTLAGRLRLIFPFYNEEVHLFARKDIQRFADLQGKRLAVGEQGSGNWLTSLNLLQMTGVKPQELAYLSPLKAVAAVLQGKADAMIYVAGKPVPLFTLLSHIKENPNFAPLFDQVHFLPLNDPAMLREYRAAEITPVDYPWIDQAAPTLAVKAVLMSFDFSSKQTPYYKQRCNELARLGQAVRAQLEGLKQNGHPKWKEVNLEENVGAWKLDACSRQAPGKAGLSQELEKVLRNPSRN